MLYPLRYAGDGEFKAASAYHARALDKHLVIGEVLIWEQVHPRSVKSHSHYFAVLEEAWLNLPETISMEFPTMHHLRTYCLIKAGYCTVTKVACATNRSAITLIASVAEMDSFAVCELTNNNVVTTYRAKSQSTREMGAEEFQKSKTAVLEIVSEMVGVEFKENKNDKAVNQPAEAIT